MKHKKFIIALVVLVIIGVGYVALTEPVDINESPDAPISEERAREDDVIVYETEVDSAADCTSYETYDAEGGMCVFECSDPEECDAISRSIDEELDGWSEGEYVDAPQNEDEDAALQKTRVGSYKVLQDEKLDKLAQGEDKTVWNHIAQLAPDSLSNMYIERFETFDNKDSDILAFVDDEDGNGKWRVGVNLPGYRDSNVKERNLTIVHELAHIITLNNKQLNSKIKESKCTEYFTDEGCAEQKSYLNIFVGKFWNAADIDAAYNGNGVSYKKQKFVTEYASSNPEEDIAESFAYFVVGKKEEGDQIRNQKVNLFYGFPELVAIRDTMRSAISADVIRARKTITP